MKRLILFLTLLILLPSILAHSLEEGKTETIEGREITITSLKQDKAVFQVDTEKNIINLGSSKEISGVRIALTDILYTGDSDSTASFTVELTYTCGDLICDPSESPQNCCQDCACEIGQQCTSSGCIAPECFLDEDCDDHKELTKDKCEDYKCNHKSINCTEDRQCDDNDADTDDFCSNGSCQNLPPICKTDEDCQDTNPCTLDQCLNKDCQYKKIPDCNTPEPQSTPNEEEKIIQFTRDDDPNFFQKFFTWIKSVFT